MKRMSGCILSALVITLMSSCNDKADVEKYQKLIDFRESLTEYYDKLEQQNNISEGYDSMKLVLDSLYEQKDIYREKIDSAICNFEKLKEDAKRLKHDYFPTKTEDIADDMKEVRNVIEDGMKWLEEQTDSLEW